MEHKRPKWDLDHNEDIDPYNIGSELQVIEEEKS